MRNIRQNLFFALVFNGIGIPIAAGTLYPAFGWRLSPMTAAAAVALSSLSVVGNASRRRGCQAPPAARAPAPQAVPATTGPAGTDLSNTGLRTRA